MNSVREWLYIEECCIGFDCPVTRLNDKIIIDKKVANKAFENVAELK
jgi:hypothetical protein